MKLKMSGFSLPELLISVAVLGGLVLVGMKVMSMQQSETNKSHVNNNVNLAAFAINSAVGKIEGCEETFVKPGTVRPEGAGSAVEKIFSRQNSLVFEKNASIGQRGASHSISISEMVLKNYSEGGASRGQAEFHVTFNRKGLKSETRKFLVGVVVTNGLVTGCMNLAEGSIDCVGTWTTCTKKCEGGVQEYRVSTSARNGGETCAFADKESRACNTQSCSSWASGAWSACLGGSGFWTYEWGAACTGKMVNYTGPYCDGGILSFCTSCGWVGTQTRSGTCNYSANSGTQTRTVTCQKDGVTVADSECKDAKPATSQQCTPSNSSVCGAQSGASSRTCTPTEPNPCTFTEECNEAGAC